MTATIPITVHVTQKVYQSLVTVVQSCNQSNLDRRGATTHGELDVPKLLTMLAEDAAMTIDRPGSWEGSNMQQVLDSHGYL